MVDEVVSNGGVEIRPWDVLCEQIKDDLKKGSKRKKLSLSQTNQLLILRNFATLRLKGFSITNASIEIARQWHEGEGVHFAKQVRKLARHYQIFEQLPKERRGGLRVSSSLLSDERVKTAARSWLSIQPLGEITPKRFQQALNATILPLLGIQPKSHLSERTARRWLVKLGWRRVELRKGVYMDGHERADVVEYRNNIFLPAMKEFQAFTATWEEKDGKFIRAPPKLKPGDKEIIPNFQDESCFAGHEYKKSAW